MVTVIDTVTNYTLLYIPPAATIRFHRHLSFAYMKKIRRIVQFIKCFHSLKYVVVVIVAIAIVGFLDENSIYHHIHNKTVIRDLQQEIDQYESLYEADQENLRKLDEDPKAIEKIARERYFMKAEDEDIFVISE